MLAVNFALTIIRPFHTPAVRDVPANHTWEWWRAREYTALPAPPDVVLMGSSLMMIPTSLYDADFLNRDIDVAVHCRSRYLEHLLGTVEPGLTCFNFSLPGCMASDDYMIQRTMFSPERKPKLIVVGLTLRDFIDSHCPCAASTSAFQFFQRFTSVDEVLTIAAPEIWQQIVYAPSSWFYICGKKWQLQSAFESAVARAMARFASPIAKQLPGDQQVQNNSVVAKLGRADSRSYVLKPHEPWLFEDNQNEYKKRFSNVSEKQFQCQVSFLNRFLAEAQANQIRVLVVNMPLTGANVALMPPGYYDKYLAAASGACTEYGARWTDLSKSGVFAQSDFRDTVHMNATGGKRLLDIVAAAMTGDERLRTALAPGSDSTCSKLSGISHMH